MADALVAADLRFMREVNTTAVLAQLRERDKVSVTELAGATGLSRQAVTRVLGELQDVGLVTVLPPERSGQRSGRPAQQVRLRAEAGYVVGAFIDPHQIRLAVADLRGTVAATTQAELAAGEHDAVALLVREVTTLLDRAGISATDVHSAAVGAPGIVDPEVGVISLVPSMPELTGDVVVRALSDHLDCPVYLDNDVKLATRGEQRHGSHRDAASLVVVYWGERIGAGILLDGALYRGAHNDAGDLGFLDVLAPGARTVPGLGRFEAWAGSSALLDLAAAELARAGEQARREELLGAGDDALDIVLDGAHRGDAPFAAALRQVAARFVVGLGAIRTLLDPHLVVLSGPVARAGAPLLAALRDAVADHPLELPELELSTLGADAVVHGAIDHCLSDLERSRYAPIAGRRTG